MALEVEGVKFVADLSSWTPGIKKVVDDTGNAEKSMDSMAKTFNDGLKVVESSIVAVGAAYATFDRAISQGEGIIQGKALFTAMAGGAQAAARGEEELAQATRGLVDDDIALAGASKLLSLHLADNVDQASQIVGLGTQLGRVFLRDAAGGINAFNVALANTSARGLQQLGISYDEVEKRQKELERQGLSTRDAFRQAMIEVATAVRDKLGDSVIMAGSALERLKNQANEFFDTILERAATGFEGIVGIAQITTGSIGSSSRAAQRQIDDLAASAQSALQIAQATGRTLTSADFQLTPGQTPSAEATNLSPIIARINAQRQLNENAAEADRRREESLERQGAEYGLLIARQNVLNMAIIRESDQIEAVRAANLAQIREQEQAQQDYNNAVEQSTGQMMILLRDQDQLTNSMLRGRGTFNGTMLFTDQDATNARNIANAAQEAFRQISETKDKYPDIVSDADYQRMQDIAQSANRWADQAERGARAFDSMNLAQLLGQTSGGPAGEIINQIETFLSSEGQNVENLQQIKDAMELVTGQQTTASEALQNDIVPALAAISQSNATAAAQSAVAIQDYAKAQALAGQQVTEAGMLAAGGLGVNPNAGSRQITVRAGMSATEAAQANNISIAQLLATTGALNVNSVPTGTFTMNGGTAVVPLQGPGTTFGGGAGTLAQQGGLIAPGGANTGPGAPLVNGQQEITDAATNVQNAVTTTESVVQDKTVAMGGSMTSLNTTGQQQLTGATGLTAWWDQLQVKIQSVYNVINPLITQIAQGITQINSGAQNLNATPSNYANNTTVNPTTGRGYAIGGPIARTGLVGDRGPELFTPHRAGYIVNAANTDSILSALAGVLNGGGGNHIQNNQRTATVNQYVTVQSSAQAASAMMNVTDALRGYA